MLPGLKYNTTIQEDSVHTFFLGTKFVYFLKFKAKYDHAELLNIDVIRTLLYQNMSKTLGIIANGTSNK